MGETFAQYKQRILATLGDRPPLQVLAATPARLSRLTAKASAARLSRRPAPAKWSVREIVAHLADMEMLLGSRMRSILGQPGIDIVGIDQDRWQQALRYERLPLASSLAAFASMRKYNLAMLRGLTPQQWSAAGLHRERGRETVADMSRLLAGHDLNHLAQVEAILAP